ncbi:ATP-binding cassette domain-containing protein [Photobacterium profundum]|uniref:Hypothetical phosphonate ABC transporter, ATP-binding protein n=1 Tax=Photobacterium profundum 3TCK TaxID=314280 RepID=Q1Z2X9_9GAMM|nr:ATP-binding cassette domain-containing protein [Photobacterium profundum]EAS42788.1 hypothetical phosphonate ABC transporter, ATP-binding protein [Photobacterium profundum 3TCK]
MALLELKNAELGYEHNPVLHDISLSIESGEKVALIGPSGAGKSTLLNQLHSLIYEETALCPQSHGLVGPLSLYNNIYMARLEQFNVFQNVWNLIKPQQWNEVAAIADTLGLRDKMRTSIDKLSGGHASVSQLGGRYIGISLYLWVMNPSQALTRYKHNHCFRIFVNLTIPLSSLFMTDT